MKEVIHHLGVRPAAPFLLSSPAVKTKAKPAPEVGAGPAAAKNLRRWRPEFAFRIYDLYKTGLPMAHVAGALGVRPGTLSVWLEHEPAAALAKSEGLLLFESNSQTFQEYVFDQLPENLQLVWKALDGIKDGGVIGIEAALANTGKRGRQYLFMQALVANNFNASAACRMVNITKRTFDLWANEDPDFADLLANMKWHKANLFESKLIELVRAGDTSAVLFVNRTMNKDRGYGDKVEVEHTHTHKVGVQIEDLEPFLDLEAKKAILEAIRRHAAFKATGTTDRRDAPVRPLLPAVRQPLEAA